METRVAIATDLSLSPADLAAAWNGDPDRRAAAHAQVSSTAPAQYDLEFISGGLLLVVGSAVGTLAADVAKDVLKNLLTQLLSWTFAIQAT